jgi:hypothetical protein
MENYKQEYKYLGRGDAGCYADGDGFHSSIPDRRLKPYYGCLIEGGVILDKLPVFEKDAEAAIREVVSGPMLDIAMSADSSDKFGIRGLSFVGLAEYLGTWRKLGARVGQRVGETIEWEDGVVEPIPVYENRWS